MLSIEGLLVLMLLLLLLLLKAWEREGGGKKGGREREGKNIQRRKQAEVSFKVRREGRRGGREGGREGGTYRRTRLQQPCKHGGQAHTHVATVAAYCHQF